MPQKGKTNAGAGGNIASRVRESVTGPVEEAGYRIWDVTYYKEVSEMVLEISIDKPDRKPGAIGTDDCMTVTKIVDPILDELDPIEDSYSLMVSGGGCIRELRLPEHYAFALENAYPVEVRLFSPLVPETPEPETPPKGKAKKPRGVKELSGTLRSYDEQTLVLATDSGEVSLDRKQVAKVTAFCDLEEPGAQETE